MGANTSKPAAPEFVDKRLEQETLVEQAKELADSLATLDLNGVPTSPYGSLESGLFKQIPSYPYREQLFRTPTSTRLSSGGHPWLMTHSSSTLHYPTRPTQSQTNCQVDAAGCSPPQIQSYLFFYDKLEKANYYLENSMELAQRDLDERLVQYLSLAPLNDGGQWDMAVNLLERYGVVPQPIYPESYSSSNSGRMDRLLTTKVREHALRLRKLDQALRATEWYVRLAGEGQTDKADVARIAVLRKKKEEFMREIYNILTICLGVPPSPNKPFTWEYYDKDEKAKSWTGTPVEFYKAFGESGKNKPTEAFSLINDPRNEYGKLYTVDRLGNVWGGKTVRYVNTTSENMKAAVVKCIRGGLPVFFGCDVGQSSQSSLGIMDTGIYDYERAFGIKLESSMTHAMVITAVHLDGDGKPVRFKVENSWGENVGDKGFFVMTSKWFDEFVYQVVTPRHLAEKEFTDVLDNGEAHVLPAWDPMYQMVATYEEGLLFGFRFHVTRGDFWARAIAWDHRQEFRRLSWSALDGGSASQNWSIHGIACTTVLLPVIGPQWALSSFQVIQYAASVFDAPRYIYQRALRQDSLLNPSLNLSLGSLPPFATAREHHSEHLSFMDSIPPKFKKVWKSKYFSSKKLAPASAEAVVVPTEESKSVITDDTQETKVKDDAKSIAEEKESIVQLLNEDDVDLGVIPRLRKMPLKEDAKEDAKKGVENYDNEIAEKDEKKDPKGDAKEE
ncbi:4156_t:CDS:10, partial [Acaulospora colombiana]